MLNEEQAKEVALLHKIQFAVETVDVSKFYEAIIYIRWNMIALFLTG